jgi:hypothetical protein
MGEFDRRSSRIVTCVIESAMSVLQNGCGVYCLRLASLEALLHTVFRLVTGESDATIIRERNDNIDDTQ